MELNNINIKSEENVENLHAATIGSGFTSISFCNWFVKNRVCFVRTYCTPANADNVKRAFATGLPKGANMSWSQNVITSTLGTNSRVYTFDASSGTLYITGNNSTSESYYTFSYAIVDDYTE